MKKKNVCIRGLTVLLIFAVFFICTGMTNLHSDGCEKAFLRCTEDPYWQAVAFGIVYCITGYVFCKKYIEG